MVPALQTVDASFFFRMLRREQLAANQAGDKDLILLEQLVPVLAEGLEALSRHIDAAARKPNPDPEAAARFRPATWLAQFLLRHHPTHHPTPTTEFYKELVELERARREIVKRKDSVQHAFSALERSCQNGVPPQRIYAFVVQVDNMWRLGGALSNAVDQDTDFGEILELADPPEPYSPVSDEKGEEVDTQYVVNFDAFWDWFYDLVETNDIVRMQDFTRGEKARLEEQTRESEESKLLQERKEIADAHEAELNVKLAEFDKLAEELYADDVIAQMREGRFTLEGAEEDDVGAPVNRPHVRLLVEMLKLWGIECNSAAETWDGYAITAWDEWVERVEGGGEGAVVSAQTLQVFLNRERFQQFQRQEQAKEDFGAEYFIEQLGVTALERERKEEIE
jgi:hypothetical protein